MFEKPSKILLATRYYFGSGGGGTTVKTQPLSSQIKDLTTGFKNQIYPTFQQFRGNESYLQQLDQFTQGAIPGYEEQLKNLPSVSQLTDPLRAQLSGMPDIGTLTDPLQQRLGNLIDVQPSLQAAYGQVAPVLASGGALTTEGERTAQQQALQTMSQGGNIYGNQAAVADVLNREAAKQTRFGQAQQSAQNIEGLQGGDIGQRLGLATGIEGLRSTDIGNRLGLTQGIQGAESTDIGQRLGLGSGIQSMLSGAEQAGVGAYSGLINPLYGLSAANLGANTQAQIANAQAGASQKSGQSGLVGAGVGAAGSIAAALIGL